jgi:antitoxin ChpS
MATVTLRNLGGSVVMTLPKKILDLVNLHSGSQVSIAVQDNRLVIEPKPKPRYKLTDLMAQCDLSAPLDIDDLTWLNDPSVGNEDI